MKTKTNKNNKKVSTSSRPPKQTIVRRHIAVWSAILAATILVVAYQIVRANNDSGLALTAPVGSLAREAQLDKLEQQQQSTIDTTYITQQSSNAQGDMTTLNSVSEVLDNATR
jgi:hypothetical protein